MHENTTSYPGSFQQLADARRALKVANALRKAPVLPAEERAELERIRALAIRCIEAATAELIDTLDALDDPDSDTGDGEDELPTGRASAVETDRAGVGCTISDPGDIAWIEWDKMPPSCKRGSNLTGNRSGRFSEDDEDDDPGGGNVEDDGEPVQDAEVETWSHWLDHPAELHVGKRPGWNDDTPPEAA